MRFPVFAPRSNPSVSRPILRKSKTYVAEQVESGRADWVDSEDQSKGILCRELLNFGPKLEIASPAPYMPVLELPGLKFIPPPNQTPFALKVWHWIHSENEIARLQG